MFKSIYTKFLSQGADGIRPFNAGNNALAKELADQSALTKFVEFEEPVLNIRAITQ